jgi:hypothetical protein
MVLIVAQIIAVKFRVFSYNYKFNFCDYLCKYKYFGLSEEEEKTGSHRKSQPGGHFTLPLQFITNVHLALTEIPSMTYRLPL